MSLRWTACGLVAACSLAAAFAGCGDSQVSPPDAGPIDASLPKDAAPTPAIDAGTDAEVDGGVDPLYVPTRLVSGNVLPIDGPANEHIVYYDPTAKELRIVGRRPGVTPKTITASAASPVVRVPFVTGEPIVFFRAKSDDGGPAGNWGVWTEAGGAVLLDAAAHLDNAIVTADRSRLLYFADDTTDAGMRGYRPVARSLASLATAATPLGSLIFSATSCGPVFHVKDPYIVTRGCQIGASRYTLARYDPSQAFAETVLVSDARTTPAPSSTGPFYVYADTNNKMARLSVAGGTPEIIHDTRSVALMSADGTAVAMSDVNQRLVLWTPDAGARTLVDASVLSPVIVSKDVAQIAYETDLQTVDAGASEGGEPQTVDLTNLFLYDTATNTTTAVAPTATVGADILKESRATFTHDGKSLIWNPNPLGGQHPLVIQSIASINAADASASVLGLQASSMEFANGVLIVDTHAGDFGEAYDRSTTRRVDLVVARPPYTTTTVLARNTYLGQFDDFRSNDVYWFIRSGGSEDGIYVVRIR